VFSTLAAVDGMVVRAERGGKLSRFARLGFVAVVLRGRDLAPVLLLRLVMLCEPEPLDGPQKLSASALTELTLDPPPLAT
jgi:hypothetical protein